MTEMTDINFLHPTIVQRFRDWQRSQKFLLILSILWLLVKQVRRKIALDVVIYKYIASMSHQNVTWLFFCLYSKLHFFHCFLKQNDVFSQKKKMCFYVANKEKKMLIWWKIALQNMKQGNNSSFLPLLLHISHYHKVFIPPNYILPNHYTESHIFLISCFYLVTQ